MVLSCAAYGCQSKYIKGQGITFHCFPKDNYRRKLWEMQVKRKNFKSSKHSKLCSKHFESNCFNTSKLGGTHLKEDAIPTIFNFPEHFLSEKPERKYANALLAVNNGDNPNTSSSCCNEETEKKFSEYGIANTIPSWRNEEIAEKVNESDIASSLRIKRKHYLGDFTEEDLSSPETVKKIFCTATQKIEAYRKENKVLRQKTRRLEKRIASLRMKNRPSVTNFASKVIKSEILVTGAGDNEENEIMVNDIPTTVPTTSSSTTTQPIIIRRESPELQASTNHVKETFKFQNISTNKRTDKEDDECDLFAKILAKKLRKLPEHERLLLMHEIDGMFINKFYHSNPPQYPRISHVQSSSMIQLDRSSFPSTQSDSSDS